MHGKSGRRPPPLQLRGAMPAAAMYDSYTSTMNSSPAEVHPHPHSTNDTVIATPPWNDSVCTLAGM